MDETDWLRSHVELCLRDVWQQQELVVDDDGDYPFRAQTAACWVRVVIGPPHFVRVFAHAALGLKPTAAVLREVNDINVRARAGRVCLADGILVVERSLPATAVGRSELADMCAEVGVVAAELGAAIAAVHGGQTPFPADIEAA